VRCGGVVCASGLKSRGAFFSRRSICDFGSAAGVQGKDASTARRESFPIAKVQSERKSDTGKCVQNIDVIAIA
jgi:hypothetical protein